MPIERDPTENDTSVDARLSPVPVIPPSITSPLPTDDEVDVWLTEMFGYWPTAGPSHCNSTLTQMPRAMRMLVIGPVSAAPSSASTRSRFATYPPRNHWSPG